MPRSIAARRMRVACAVALVALIPSASFAQYEVSASYYAGVTGTGTTLKTQLKSLMTASTRTYTSYDAARDYLALSDAVPGDISKMYLVYDRTVVNKGSTTATGFTGTSANQYGSREHVWPDSRQTGTQPDGDIHMLKPSVSSSVSSSPNAQRGNSFYGGATMTGDATRIGSSPNYQFFAGDYDKGDVARIVFYGATTYSQTLSLVNGTNDTTSNNTMGDLNTMLHWHYLDTPDTFELRRNDVIARGDDAATAGDDYAWAGVNARNAYIDRPEYVWSVYADQANDTKLTLANGATAADGSSTQTVNLGRVLKGAAVPASQTITLSKKGVDGTYYSVTTGGSATSSVGGRYNAFAMDADGTKAITVGLNTTTTTAGLKSGTVTIDNLDVTTGGGAGAGANDGNDVATVQLSVLDSSNSSFSNAADQNALTLDFGTLAQSAASGSKSFTVYDLASTLGSALTAMLDLDATSASGDASKFSTSLAGFSNLAADGVGRTFSASFDTSTLGTFAATYLLNFSDENLAGTQTTSMLTLTLTGTVAAAVPEPTTLAATATLLVTFVRRRRIF